MTSSIKVVGGTVGGPGSERGTSGEVKTKRVRLVFSIA